MDELLRCLATDDPVEVVGLDAAELRAWMRARGIDVAPQHAGRALAVWTRLHGLVSLEINGNFASVGVDSQALYVDAVDVDPVVGQLVVVARPWRAPAQLRSNSAAPRDARRRSKVSAVPGWWGHGRPCVRSATRTNARQRALGKTASTSTSTAGSPTSCRGDRSRQPESR